VIILRKDEFMRQIEGCKVPERFDQHLLDHASEMFDKWGRTGQYGHMDEKEYLFEQYGLADKPGDSQPLKKEKEALRCVCSKMMEAKLNRKDASEIIRNFNKINDPNFSWSG
jgi:hypothetical protein